MLYEKSRLVWNQVRHIAEVLDKNGRKARNTAAIGSDFDGIVDPLKMDSGPRRIFLHWLKIF
jgi:hypothetical protein